jgi:hypothetical protein
VSICLAGRSVAKGFQIEREREREKREKERERERKGKREREREREREIIRSQLLVTSFYFSV